MGMGSRESEGDWVKGVEEAAGGGEPRRERGGDITEWYRRKHLLVGKRMKWGVAATGGGRGERGNKDVERGQTTRQATMGKKK